MQINKRYFTRHAPIPYNLDRLAPDVDAGGVVNPEEQELLGPGAGHREVGGRRRHLPVSAELQRRAADLRSFHQHASVPTKTHLGESQQDGTHSSLIHRRTVGSSKFK